MPDRALEINEQSFKDLEKWQERNNYLEPSRAAFLDGWEQGRRYGEGVLGRCSYCEQPFKNGDKIEGRAGQSYIMHEKCWAQLPVMDHPNGSCTTRRPNVCSNLLFKGK